MKKRVVSWRIAVVILFIFGMGFACGKLTEISRISKLQGYKININTIESDALIVEETGDLEGDTSTLSDVDTSTSSDVDTSTSSDVDTSTSSDVETSTSSDVETSTSSDVETSTSSDVETSTSSDVETSTSSDVETSTSSDVETSTSSNAETSSNKENASKLEYSVQNITDKQIKEIKSSKNNTIILIDANKKSIISKELFSAIKGTDRLLTISYNGDKWSFKGNEIEEVKDIDVSIEKRVLTSEDKVNINDAIAEGILIEFRDNGELPSAAVIEITLTEDMKKLAVNNKFNLYYYNTEKNELELIKKEVEIIDGTYVSFQVTHNSKYILSDEQHIRQDIAVVDVQAAEDVVSFVDDNMTYLIVIVASVLAIIVIGIIIIISKKSKLNKEVDELVENRHENDEKDNTKE